MEINRLQEQIRVLRDMQNITLRELGQISGVPHTSISIIERCLKHPMLDTMYKILAPLGYELTLEKSKDYKVGKQHEIKEVERIILEYSDGTQEFFSNEEILDVLGFKIRQ